MQSLALAHGDLVVSSGRCAMVTGRDKLLQDLSLWLRERLGVGYTTPVFGSRLPDMVGSVATEETEADIQSEVTRILSLYQTYQYNMIKAAQENGVPIQYSKNEILDEIRNIKTRMLSDRVIVDVTIATLSGIEVTFPVSITESEVLVG